jgi:ribonuclease-3
LLKKAGARDADVAVLERAFVHESAVRDGLARVSNERLEFMGDSVLGLLASRWLFARHPSEPEGLLALRKSALVSDDALAATAEDLGFADLMIFGAGTSRLPPRRLRSSLAGAFEAFVAALYLHGGLDLAGRFVEKTHLRVRDSDALPLADPKTALQEFSQAKFGSVPRYEEEHEGPPHDRTYQARVSVNGEVAGEGRGPSKKAAQRAAAAVALAHFQAEAPPSAKKARAKG